MRFRFVWIPLLPLLALFTNARAMAEPVLATSENRDFWFNFTEPAVFKVRTYAQEYGIDSMLWLYDSEGVLVAQNDDYFGLDSWIEVNVQPGTYRLRAGVCCGNPDAWYGQSYGVEFNNSPIYPEPTVPSTTTTTSTTSTTVPEETTTTSTTTTSTTVPETTSTTSTTEAPIESTTTTWPETTVAPVTTVTTVVPATTVPVTTNAPVTVVTVVTTTTSSTSTTTTTSEAPTESVPEQEGPEPTLPQPTPEEDEEVSPEEIIKELDDLDNLTDEEVTNILQEIASADLSDEEAALISEVISQASPEIKREFEETVDVFSGQFDTYVPLNSVVNVGTRRTLIAATAGVAMAASAPSPRRRQ
jgi:hypothetical protein